MVLHKLLTLTGPLGIWYREDNKTIIHHKVAARVTCILSAEDAIVASRDPAQYSNPTAAFQPANALHTHMMSQMNFSRYGVTKKKNRLITRYHLVLLEQGNDVFVRHLGRRREWRARRSHRRPNAW